LLVRITTGTAFVVGSVLRRRQAWYPFMRGIITSRMTRSTPSTIAFSMASRPSCAVNTA